jgi:hypothetical protein
VSAGNGGPECAQTAFERTERLFTLGDVSQAALDQATAARDQASGGGRPPRRRPSLPRRDQLGGDRARKTRACARRWGKLTLARTEPRARDRHRARLGLGCQPVAADRGRSCAAGPAACSAWSRMVPGGSTANFKRNRYRPDPAGPTRVGQRSTCIRALSLHGTVEVHRRGLRCRVSRLLPPRTRPVTGSRSPNASRSASR